MDKNTNPRSDSDAPLKLKVYGIPMTRNTYLILQVALYVVVILLLLGLKPVLTQFRVFAFVFDHFVPFLFVVALLELGETFFMVKRFKAEQQE